MSWLSSLVAPVSANEFVASYWSAQPLFCRGAHDRFADLLSWDQLNTILEHHWRETYRFRLASKGRDLAPSSYAEVGGHTPRVRTKDVTAHLRCGATLSFDAIDELHPPLTRLAESIEACFHSATQINIYAGFRAMHGLDLHRDDQEIFILQLDGPKRWLLYGFSIDDVDVAELRSRSLPPTGATVDRVLEPGDLLYIPRGCYHVAVPMNVPTLHLTIGVKTGSNCKARPSFSLPFSATAEGLPPGAAFSVRLNPPLPRMVHDESGDSITVWQCGSRTCRFPRAMRTILAHLADGQPMLFSHLGAAVAGELDEAAVRFLVGMLVSQNLVAIRQA